MRMRGVVRQKAARRRSELLRNLVLGAVISGIVSFSFGPVPAGSRTAFADDDVPDDTSFVNEPAEEVRSDSESETATRDTLAPGGLRQRPGGPRRETRFAPFVYESIPDINSSAGDYVPVPDRWRQFYAGKWYDPYNQNELKGDLPMFGEDWFIELGLISDTLVERRRLPIPVGFQSTQNPDNNDIFGNGFQTAFNQNLVPSIAIIKGNTTFKPPDLEIRIVPVLNVNHARAGETGVLRADPALDNTRDDGHVGFYELFIDKHLVNISERYDFISSRVGIQRFNSDFRGFVFNSDEPGVRLFGNYDNNIYQYNLAWFHRLNKDTNSGINTTFEDRFENVLVGNVYIQDLLAFGHTVQGSVLYRADTAGNHGQHYDENGFLVRPTAIGDERPKNIYSTYFGLNGDGHFGRLNNTFALYYVTGSESHNQIAERGTDISAAMAALELSYDIDYIRVRTSAFWASGDSDPFDGKGEGFDAIFDTPNFAGGEFSFFQRQGIPLVMGGGTTVVNRLSLLPNLRPSKEEGQSNFVNPGLRLVNAGVDFEVLPELKIITNANYIQFDDTAVLETVRQDGSISRTLGYDLSAGVIYRPFLNNNVQLRGGSGVLFVDDSFKNLYGDDVLWDVFGNVILVY